MLYIGKLIAPLEPALRNPGSRERALQTITERMVAALEAGLGRHQNPFSERVGLTKPAGESSRADQSVRVRPSLIERYKRDVEALQKLMNSLMDR